MRVSGKVALVTGGGSGIGAAICQRLAEEGAIVMVSDIDLVAASKVAADITESRGQAFPVEQDVTDEARWTEVFKEGIESFGKVDVLVNNAGIVTVLNVEEESLESWRKTQSINLDAVFVGTREAIKVMKDSGGSIINISSIEGIVGHPQFPAYNASKGGVRTFTKSAALHCADKKYAVRVNSVHPGFIETPMVANAIGSVPSEQGQALAESIAASIPMGYLGEPIDVANGVLYLASDESKYTTGSELVMDGGCIAR
jgi:3(or 17)beta-hydroxysteroid dehydrogenase